MRSNDKLKGELVKKCMKALVKKIEEEKELARKLEEDGKITKEDLNSSLFAGRRKFHFTVKTFQISQGLIQF